ncbi:MAG: nuclease-related domain-containing protein, partial [Chloroflexota bacterium]
MGELLDEGFLTQVRLEWAATKAYDPSLREAAQVLMASEYQSIRAPTSLKTSTTAPAPSDAPLEIDISLEQARNTRWTIPPYKNQLMGALVDSRQLSLKDLGYAAENAWDERVRRAATALMLIRLQQVVKEPKSPAGLVHVVSGGRSFSERRQYLYVLLEGALMGLVLGIFIVLEIWALSSPPGPSNLSVSQVLGSPSGILGLVVSVLLVVILPIFLLHKTINRLDKQIENHRRGEEGEDRVVTTISQSLDGNWFLFRNVLLPGRSRTDLDGVLVGPSGVWVLEIKAYTREHRNIGEHWEYRAGNRWKLSRSNPSRQAKNNAVHLADFLRADRIKQWITPVVVWANPESSLTVENPGVSVWVLDRLLDELGNIWHGNEIPEVNRQQIVDKLTKLCERQAKAT